MLVEISSLGLKAWRPGPCTLSPERQAGPLSGRPQDSQPGRCPSHPRASRTPATGLGGLGLRRLVRQMGPADLPADGLSPPRLPVPPEVGQGRRDGTVTAAALPTGGRDDPTGPSHCGHLCPGPSPWPPLHHVRRAPSLYSNFHPQPLRAASLGTTPHPFAVPLALDFLPFRQLRVMPARLLVHGRRPSANSKPREGGSTAGLLATCPHTWTIARHTGNGQNLFDERNDP